MAETLALLALPNSDALQQMVQESLVPGVSVSDLVISSPVPGEDLDMVSRIFVSGDAYEQEGWPYYGNADFTYTRLDLADLCRDINLRFKMPVPFNTFELAQRLGLALQIHFDPEDVFLEIVDQNEYNFHHVLRAGPASKRWVGQVNVHIYRTTPLTPEV